MITKASSMRCVGFTGMLWSFVTTLRDDYVATCDAMCWFFWDAMIFCNNFARWLQKIVVCDAMCWFFWDATIFCNNFARWLRSNICCAGFLGCYRKFRGQGVLWNCSVFVRHMSLCNKFVRWLQNHNMLRQCNAIWFVGLIDVMIFL